MLLCKLYDCVKDLLTEEITIEFITAKNFGDDEKTIDLKRSDVSKTYRFMHTRVESMAVSYRSYTEGTDNWIIDRTIYAVPRLYLAKFRSKIHSVCAKTKHNYICDNGTQYRLYFN